MTADESARLAAILIGSTTGWNDDAADTLMANMMHRWANPDIGREAIDRVINTWTSTSRPPWGVLVEAYRTVARHRALDGVEIERGSGEMIPVSEGRDIAARYYALECSRRDPHSDPHILSGFRTNEPNPLILDRLVGAMGEES